MKWKTFAVLGLVAFAGCGGGDDDEDTPADGGGDQAASTTTGPAAPEPEPIKGKYTKAKIIQTAGLKKNGDGYIWPDKCEVADVAADKAGVKALQKAAEDPATVIPNKSNTVAIQIVQQTYPCAVHASLFLRGVP